MKPSAPKRRGSGRSVSTPNTQRGTKPTANHAAAHVKPIPSAPRMRRSHFRMIASAPALRTRAWLSSRHVCSLRDRKQQLIAVGILDLDRVVPPPGLLGRNSAYCEFPLKMRERLRSQLDEQPSPVAACSIFAEDDLTVTQIDLAD